MKTWGQFGAVSEARGSKYAAAAKELREKLMSLVPANIDLAEIKEAMLGITDMFEGTPKIIHFIEYRYKDKPNMMPGRIMQEDLEGADSYRELKQVYDSMLLDKAILDVCTRYEINCGKGFYDFYARKEALEEEWENAKAVLESMGYSISKPSEKNVVSLGILFLTVRKGADCSSIKAGKDYHAYLPASLVKTFDEFMLAHKASDESAAEFARALSQADWNEPSGQ